MFEYPFRQVGTVTEMNGDAVAEGDDIPINVSPSSRSDDGGGPHGDFDGITPPRFFDLFEPNRRVVVAERTYRVIRRRLWGAIPHVELDLRALGD